MGKVDAFRIEGMDTWFNSSDHGPPHFHAKRPGQWEVRVYIVGTTSKSLLCGVKWGGEPNSGDRRMLAHSVSEHAPALLSEWEEKVRT